MTESASLAGKFLLALPGMGDPRFRRAAIAMMVHGDEGALGIDPGQAPDCAVLDGGPVEPQRGFVVHTSEWEGADTIRAGDLCALSASLEVLRAIAAGTGPERFLVALGYAGWSGGQLEGELHHHGWQVIEGDSRVLFDTAPEARWETCWRNLGIDPALLAGETGRA